MASKKSKTTKKREPKPLPPSPIDRMGWTGKSRRIRLRLDVIGSMDRDVDEEPDEVGYEIDMEQQSG
jgi:hypothetical protein